MTGLSPILFHPSPYALFFSVPQLRRLAKKVPTGLTTSIIRRWQARRTPHPSNPRRFRIRRYGDEAIIALIFAGFSSAVTSVFIINIQGKLQPDYTPMNYALLSIIAHATLGKFPLLLTPHSHNGLAQIPPSSTFKPLSASLLAAFIAVSAKQWINRYSRAEMSVSTIDRIRHRQRTTKGMVTWHFDSLVESLPLLLQAALLLLGHALSDYLFTINSVVAGVVVGVLFYLLIRSAATLSYNCPFQVPVSFVSRSMIRFDDEH
ncbi:hypothetical protein BJ322DRAFT_1109863 [Thelephora terrestris]|uniref:DUF6535 domain-containing protein n=1 Tax=Thelephora terrestris TaxID=56493 RepID=A0A9P6L5W2_9AGAM|nr:hypothetical protein BJ322DRAFT_1109863 [Thelephora terrestris]